MGRIVIECDCCRTQPQRPKKPTLGRVRQFDMANFGVTFGLPATTVSDVANRELTVTVNGGDPPSSRTYLGTAILSDEWVFADGDNVSVTLVDIDGHNNRSQPSAAFVFVVTDTVPPPQPNSVGVNSVRQID